MWPVVRGGVAEGLICSAYTLTHRHPPPSPQKSDTCANPVGGLFKNLKRAARFLQGNVSFRVTFWTGNFAWSRPVQISTSKIASLAFWEIECREVCLGF